MKLHHIGYACRDIKRAIDFFEQNYPIKNISEIIYDELQCANLCLITLMDNSHIELVSGKPVNSFLEKEINLYHSCYEVDDLELVQHNFIESGAVAVSPITEAKLFNNRRIVFLHTDMGLIELLESEVTSQHISSFSQNIIVSSTFTCTSVVDYIHKFFNVIEKEVRINEVNISHIQSALPNTYNDAHTNRPLIVLLLRCSDLVSDKKRKYLIQSLRQGKALNSNIVIILCPDKQYINKDDFNKVKNSLSAIEGATITSASELVSLYGKVKVHSTYSEDEANIPYSEDFDAVMAVFIARKIYQKIEYRGKVIAVDCDNTLWEGVVGEDNKNIVIREKHKWLQNFLADLHRAGFLLCIVSKNNFDDVYDIFTKNDNMIIKADDVSLWKVNWEKKSRNIANLSKELNIALEDIIFIDDNVSECSEVSSVLPEVFTIQIPNSLRDTKEKIEACWIFDKKIADSKNQGRQNWYRNNYKRIKEYSLSNSLQEYFEKLNVKIDIELAKTKDYERLSELSYRVTQFNLSNIKYDSHELISKSEKSTIFKVSVKDDYDDYGIVSFFIMEAAEDVLLIESFFISCRALNLNVEKRVIEFIKKVAADKHINNVHFYFRESQRNVPALNFLRYVCEDKYKAENDLICYITTPERLWLPIDYIDNSQSESQFKLKKETFLTNQQLYFISNNMSGTQSILNALSVKQVKLDDESKGLKEKLKSIWSSYLDSIEIQDNDDFFELGGNSLTALRVCEAIDYNLSINVPLYKLLKITTFIEFYLYVLSRRNNASKNKFIKKLRNDRADNISLSESQKSLVFLEEACNAQGGYNIPYSYELNGRLNIEKLQYVLNDIAYQENMLNAYINETEKGYKISYKNTTELKIEKVDAKSWEAGKLDSAIREAISLPFDLKKAPLFRCFIFSTSEQRHILLLVFHHMIFDGKSIDIFNRLFSDGYNSNKPRELEKSAFTFEDYLQWESNYLTSSEHSKNLQSWKELLCDYCELEYPLSYARRELQALSGQYMSMDFPESYFLQIKKISSKYKTTPTVIFYSIFIAVLNSITGSFDITIGVPVSMRPTKKFDNIIGNFVNPIPVRTVLSDESTLDDFIGKCHEDFYNSYELRHVPLREIVKAIGAKLEINKNPIFQIMYAFQDNDNILPKLDGLSTSRYKQGYNASRLDFTLEVNYNESSLYGGVYYNNQLFSHTDVQRLIDIYLKVLSKFILLKTTSSYNSLFEKLELTKKKPGENCCNRYLHEMYEENASLQPDYTAVLFDGKNYSYNEVNIRSNQLAHCLKDKYQLRENSVVAFSLSRNINVVVIILACAKLGVTYLPISAKYPENYVSEIFEEVMPALFLVDNSTEQKYQNIHSEFFNIELNHEKLELFSDKNLGLMHSDEYISYIIFTSGTTGKPKGVQVGFKSITNLIVGAEKIFNFTKTDVVPLFHAYSFDVSVWEVWSTFYAGGTLFVLSDKSLAESDMLWDEFHRAGVTVLNLTPSAYENILLPFINQAENCLAKLRLILFAGEKLYPSSLKKLILKCGSHNKPKIYNLYGATEATVHSTFKEVTDKDICDNKSKIGKPLPGVEIKLLDENLKDTLVNQIGEIFIGGEGLSARYINEKNNHKFIEINQNVFYKTGDLARLLDNNEIEYLNRKDNMVKYHGYRINLEYIDEVALKSNVCKQACTLIISKDSYDELVLVICMERNLEINVVTILSRHLRENLPAYMLPSRVEQFSTMPLAVNGKIDKDKITFLLQKDQPKRLEKSLPRKKLISIIQDTLNTSNTIDTQRNLVELGFDSFQLIRLLKKLREEYHESISMINIFNHPTVEALSKYLLNFEKEKTSD